MSINMVALEALILAMGDGFVRQVVDGGLPYGVFALKGRRVIVSPKGFSLNNSWPRVEWSEVDGGATSQDFSWLGLETEEDEWVFRHTLYAYVLGRMVEDAPSSQRVAVVQLSRKLADAVQQAQQVSFDAELARERAKQARRDALEERARRPATYRPLAGLQGMLRA